MSISLSNYGDRTDPANARSRSQANRRNVNRFWGPKLRVLTIGISVSRPDFPPLDRSERPRSTLSYSWKGKQFLCRTNRPSWTRFRRYLGCTRLRTGTYLFRRFCEPNRSPLKITIRNFLTLLYRMGVPDGFGYSLVTGSYRFLMTKPMRSFANAFTAARRGPCRASASVPAPERRPDC